MRHIVCFSGGKDSTALVLWAKENLPEFTTVFCDTGWEHPITYAYVEEINQTLLGGSLVRLKSAKYPDGFVQLSVERKRVPSACARFCTDELKVKAMILYLKTIDDETKVYQGIRAQESAARAAMKPEEWSDDYDSYVLRPLLNWLHDEVFSFSSQRGVKPNPLYLMGAGRVGCYPCVMITLRELKAYINHPENGSMLKDRLYELERLVGSNFFEPTYIPERFCTGRTEDGKAYPWCADVFRYVESVDEDQLPLLPARSCMSVYNLCE